MEPKKVLGGAARGAGHILGGEARQRLAPLKDKLRDGSAEIQSKAGRQIIRLAEKIRHIGARLEREHEAQAVARKLEETADYVRFRPAEGIARDAAQAIRRNHLIPIAVGLLGAVVAYKLVASRRDDEQ